MKGRWLDFSCGFCANGVSLSLQACCHPVLIFSYQTISLSPELKAVSLRKKEEDGEMVRADRQGKRDADRGNAKGYTRKMKNINGSDGVQGSVGGRANNYRSSHVFKSPAFISLFLWERKRESGKREDEKKKTDIQAALVQITQQTAGIHITRPPTRSH